MSQTIYVYLLWSNARAEHGEGPRLVDVFTTHQAANRRASKEATAMDLREEDGDPFSVEQRVLCS